MKEPSKISAVIITLNEEDYIEECIQSLMPVVDEVVVVDSYSTDKTKEICKNLGVEWYEHKWMGYADTKNWANYQASNDWVLAIDADEVLTPLLASSIQEAKIVGLSESKVYSFNRLNNYCGVWLKYAGWYPDVKVRLFVKNNAKWEGSVHEKLVFNRSVSQFNLKGDLLHYSIKDKEDHIARVKKYCKLENPYPNKLLAFLAATNTFIRSYILKRGFMAGRIGYQVSIISAKAKFWRGQT
ncbi:glycosyltransferase family 2 protein [Bacteroidia bacterium]|nr:glycosyltransferase family 2 protein [Bacteroidia bacterium]MDC1395159.1 glycosyltransferase family 2 protein [Bacteroidia bacterium]